LGQPVERGAVPPTRWIVAEPVPSAIRAAAPALSPVLAQILYNRGLLQPGVSAETLTRFLSPRWEDGLHDPFLMADMQPAVERILHAIEHQEKIGVYGHYDADGITAMVLLAQVLDYLGGHPLLYLPSRSDDYGVNATGIAELASQGARLLISVDCGIRSFTAPEVAARYGIDVVITDHHTVLCQEGREVLPPALAVLNPMRADCPYPYKGLAGVGVAFKLAQALLQARGRRTGNDGGNFAKWLLDLVCLGTVADVVDILDENRTLVRLGLQVLQHARRPGLSALMEAAGTRRERLNVDAVAFQLAPRINAAARLGTPQTSLDLLLAAGTATARPLAQQLNALNQRRQRLTQEALAMVAQRYGDTLTEHKAIIAAGPWPAGILGLIAGKLAETYNRPVAVVETGGAGELHGSARSRPGFHIAEALGQCADLLTQFGGHAQAAGFSLPASNLEAFGERLRALADAYIPEEALAPTLVIDALLEPEQVNAALLAEVQALEPCGQGNPAPVFAMYGARVCGAETFGATNNHLRLMLDSPGRPLRVTGWGMGALAKTLRPGNLVDLAFSLKEDAYVGLALDALDIAVS
jgi:single-stranded-DNA-specific exonuclease